MDVLDADDEPLYSKKYLHSKQNNEKVFQIQEVLQLQNHMLVFLCQNHNIKEYFQPLLMLASIHFFNNFGCEGNHFHSVIRLKQ